MWIFSFLLTLKDVLHWLNHVDSPFPPNTGRSHALAKPGEFFPAILKDVPHSLNQVDVFLCYTDGCPALAKPSGFLPCYTDGCPAFGKPRGFFFFLMHWRISCTTCQTTPIFCLLTLQEVLRFLKHTDFIFCLTERCPALGKWRFYTLLKWRFYTLLNWS